LDIKPGDVLFVWGRGIVADLIEDITNGPSHVALFLNENTLIEAQGGRLVGECSLSFYLDGKTRCEVWGDPELTDEQRQQMIENASTLYGTPYDYLLIPAEFLHFEIGLKLNWFHEHKHLICSSFVDSCGQSVGKLWTTIPNPAPVDLMRGGVLQKKGDLVQAIDLAVS
jgi:hypothetical protein